MYNIYGGQLKTLAITSHRYETFNYAKDKIKIEERIPLSVNTVQTSTSKNKTWRWSL